MAKILTREKGIDGKKHYAVTVDHEDVLISREYYITTRGIEKMLKIINMVQTDNDVNPNVAISNIYRFATRRPNAVHIPAWGNYDPDSEPEDDDRTVCVYNLPILTDDRLWLLTGMLLQHAEHCSREVRLLVMNISGGLKHLCGVDLQDVLQKWRMEQTYATTILDYVLAYGIDRQNNPGSSYSVKNV